MTPPFGLDDLAHALAIIARVVAENTPKHGDRWRREPVANHVAHAVAHLDAWRAERSSEDLEHALVRVAMAVELIARTALGAEPTA